MIRTLWRLYTQAVGVIAIAAAVSSGVIRLLSSEGPVVEAVKPAVPISTKILYLGTLSYQVSTRRLESCEGTVLYTFIRTTPQISVIIARPVQAEEISPTSNRIVSIDLPDSVRPGLWRFRSSPSIAGKAGWGLRC